jgi:hypothetical protein
MAEPVFAVAQSKWRLALPKPPLSRQPQEAGAQDKQRAG